MNLNIKLVPNSSGDEICGCLGDAPEINVRAVRESDF